MGTELKTITLGDSDNPEVSICYGHVSAKEFAKAFKAEGWTGSGSPAQADLRYEYWINSRNFWKKSNPGNKKAVPVTVNDW